jgi:hypothetical protein
MLVGRVVGSAGEMKVHTKFCSECLQKRYPFEDLIIHGRMILKWILKMRGYRLTLSGCLYKATNVGGQGCRKCGRDESAHKILLRMLAKTIPV